MAGPTAHTSDFPTRGDGGEDAAIVRLDARESGEIVLGSMWGGVPDDWMTRDSGRREWFVDVLDAVDAAVDGRTIRSGAEGVAYLRVEVDSERVTDVWLHGAFARDRADTDGLAARVARTGGERGD